MSNRPRELRARVWRWLNEESRSTWHGPWWYEIKGVIQAVVILGGGYVFSVGLRTVLGQ